MLHGSEDPDTSTTTIIIVVGPTTAGTLSSDEFRHCIESADTVFTITAPPPNLPVLIEQMPKKRGQYWKSPKFQFNKRR